MTVEEVLEKHKTMLNDYAERNFGSKVPEKNIFREVASSETIDSRPEMLKLLEQINYIGSIPPYGYDKIFITVGKKKCPTLVENKEQADVVRMIFDMYVNTNMGYKRICDRLDELNIKPPKGDYWFPPAIKDMITIVNPAKNRTTVYHYEEDDAPTVYTFDMPITVGIFPELTITVTDLLE